MVKRGDILFLMIFFSDGERKKRGLCLEARNDAPTVDSGAARGTDSKSNGFGQQERSISPTNLHFHCRSTLPLLS